MDELWPTFAPPARGIPFRRFLGSEKPSPGRASGERSPLGRRLGKGMSESSKV